MTIFRVKSVKIYAGQKKFTRIYSWRSWQISGMFRDGDRGVPTSACVSCRCLFLGSVFFMPFLHLWHIDSSIAGIAVFPLELRKVQKALSYLWSQFWVDSIGGLGIFCILYIFGFGAYLGILIIFWGHLVSSLVGTAVVVAGILCLWLWRLGAPWPCVASPCRPIMWSRQSQ